MLIKPNSEQESPVRLENTMLILLIMVFCVNKLVSLKLWPYIELAKTKIG
jgi:hypothetical protein